MKNLKLFIPALIMVSMLSGCTDDQYSMEKRFWQAQKEAEKIFNNPAATPPNELKRVVMIMDRFSTRYPKSTWRSRPNSILPGFSWRLKNSPPDANSCTISSKNTKTIRW